MARISGVDLPREKRVEIGLNIYIWYWFIKFTKNFNKKLELIQILELKT